MEDILSEITKEASGAPRLRHVKEICAQTQEILEAQKNAPTLVAYELRDKCLHPLRLALESKSSKLSGYALAGLQKLISDTRFQGDPMQENEEQRLPFQVLQALAITPTLHEDLQVEIMKLLLTVTCSASCPVTALSIIRVAEFCLSVYGTSKQEVHRACQVTLLQIVSILAQNATYYMNQLCMEAFQRSTQPAVRVAAKVTVTQMLGSNSLAISANEMQGGKENAALPNGSKTDDTEEESKDTIQEDEVARLAEVPCDAFIRVLSFFCTKLTESQRGGQQTNTQNQPLLTLQLEAILAMVSNAGPELRRSQNFLKVTWQELCPALIAILGIPRDEKHLISHHSMPRQDNDMTQDHGRGSSSIGTVPTKHRAVNRIIYCIAVELVRLIGSVESLRPVLGSLFHHILLFPPPSQRNEALNVLKEMLCNPERLMDLAGPPMPTLGSDKTTQSKTAKKTRNPDLDILTMLMDGIAEATQCKNGAVCHSSVACVGALLTALELIAQGKGLNDAHVEIILKRAEQEEEERNYIPKCVEKIDEMPANGVQGEPSEEHEETPSNEEIPTKEDVPSNENTPSVDDIKSDMPEEVDTHKSKKPPVDISQDAEKETVEESEDHQEDSQETKPENVKVDETKKDTEVDPLQENDKDIGKAFDMDDQVNDEFEEEEVVIQAKKIKKGVVSEDRDSGQEDVDSVDMEYSSGEVAAIIRATSELQQKSLLVSENGSPKQSEATGGAKGSDGEDIVHRFRYHEDESSLEEMSPRHTEQKMANAREDFKIGQSGKTISLAEQELLEQQEQRREEIERLAKINEVAERQGAREFSQALIGLLPVVIPMLDTYEVDEAIQQFSSKFVTSYTKCRHTSTTASSELNSTNDRLNLAPVINADGIYIATYYSLLLNLKLIRSDHYENPGTLPLTKKQFIDSVHDSGVLVYLSSTWLGELFQIIIENNILGEAGYKPQSYHCNKALISILTDIDGLSNQNIGGQMLHDAYSQNQKLLSLVTKSTTKAGEAGMKFATHILTTYWHQILAVLSVPLSARNLSNAGSIASLLGSESSKGQGGRERDAICLSLDSLRKAAGLSCTLGLQSRCATVFAQIANASCVSEDPFQQQHQQQQAESSKIPLRGRSNKSQGIRLHAAHILSMDSLLSMGLEMGSHSEECWKHVFRCCAYVSQLEHCHFSSGGTSPSVQSIGLSRTLTNQPDALTQDDMGGDDLDMLASYVHVPASSAPTSIDVQEVIRQESQESGFEVGSARGGMLSANSAAKVVFGLSSEVERFFDEAANNLNLQALIAFLRELRTSSQQQLYSSAPSDQEQSIIRPTSPSKSLKTAGQASNSLHLFRMADVILKCVRHSSRPLLHIMQAWNVVAPHFVEAACHKDRHVSKKAVNAIHDVLQELLMGKEELAHFNFHEALFKPFESLLRLELCDEDVQDQVVSSICEMVEASFTNIKSGWRPLFGALRAVRIHRHQPPMMPPGSPAPGGPEIEDSSTDRTEHPLAPVFNVFEAFLNTDNVAVFANAAIDCILCLLKFLRGTNDAEFLTETDDSSDGDSVSTADRFQIVDLCFPALNYLHRCHKILASIYTMPALPIFQGAESIKLGARDVSPSSTSSSASNSPLRSPRTPTTPTTATHNATGHDDDLFAPVSIETVDDESGIIRVWFLLLEGLTGAVSTCPKQHQPQTLELLFELLRSVLAIPGSQFAIFAVTELLLPMLHSWVHRSRQTQSIWDPTTGNFKHACGLATDLVVEYIVHFVSTETPLMGVYLMLRQLLDVLIECIGTSNESISRLGCSCIRHLLLSAGPVFTHDMWTVACRGMQRAITASLRSLKLLMACFQPGSEEYMGDVCSVKVAARRDASEADCVRLQQLAQQVFLLESQRTCGLELEIDEDSTRSFIFIIYPPDVDISTSIDLIKTRVPFRNVVLGLLSHQLLIQTLGTIFLYGAENQTSREQNLLPSSSVASTLSRQDSSCSLASEVIDSTLPGLLAYLTPKNLSLLLECFVQSYQVACDFNLRPGLKFLLQKVAKFEIAVNLYWQAGMSFTFYLHTLLEICNHASGDDLTFERVKGIVKELSKRGNADDDDISLPLSPESAGDGAAKSKVTAPVTEGGDLKNDGAVSEKRRRSETVESTSSTLSRASSTGKSGMEGMLLNCELSFNPDTQVDHLDWIIKRLHGICNEICASYIQMHVDDHTCCRVDSDNSQEQPLFFLVAPKSPAVVTQPTEFFGMEFEDDEEEEADIKDDEDGEGHEKVKGRGRSKSQKFAAAWTPKVKFGVGCPQEQEVNVMAPSTGAVKKNEKKKDEGKKGKQGPQLYTVATRKTIKSLMQEYKKRKTQHSRSVFVKKPTFKEQKYSRMLQQHDGSLTPAERHRRQQIREEQQTSITHDSEAQLNTWSDMILTMLQLLQLLPDSHFTALLPGVFPCLNQLICHVDNGRVRQGVMEFMDRVAQFYGIV